MESMKSLPAAQICGSTPPTAAGVRPALGNGYIAVMPTVVAGEDRVEFAMGAILSTLTV